MNVSFIVLKDKRSIDIKQGDKFWYDPAHESFIVQRGSFLYSLNLHQPGMGEILLEGPFYSNPRLQTVNIVAGRLSLDRKLLAIQISPTKIIVVDLSERNRVWEVECKSPQETTIISPFIIWSEHAGNSQDLILVTSAGLELYKVSIARSQCKLSRFLPSTIVHCWYDPNLRVILTACGINNAEMKGYFLRLDSSDLPKFELPPPEKINPFSILAAQPIGQCDIHLVCLYGITYCAHIDSNEGVITLLELSKSSSTRHAYTLQTYIQGGQMELNVIDNLLVVHCLDHKISLLFDIKSAVASSPSSSSSSSPTDSNSTVSPVSSPDSMSRFKGQLGKLVNRSPDPSSSSSSSRADHVSISKFAAVMQDPFCGGCTATYASAADLDVSSSSSTSNDDDDDDDGTDKLTHSMHAEELYGANYEVLNPFWVTDTGSPSSSSSLCHVWKLEVNLEAILTSCHEPIKIVPFLLRRGQPPLTPKPMFRVSPSVAKRSKALLVWKLVNFIKTRAPLKWVTAIFELLNEVYIGASRIASDSQVTTVVNKRALQDVSPTSSSSSSGNTTTKPIQATMSSEPMHLLSILPLEPVQALTMLLHDVTHLTSTNRYLDTEFDDAGNEAIAGIGQLNAISSYASNSSLPLCLNRDVRGLLVLTQTEMIGLFWLPLVSSLSSSASSSLDCEYLIHCLVEYTTLFASDGIPISTPLALLTFYGLCNLNKFNDAAVLIQMQVLPDSIELALAILGSTNRLSLFQQVGCDMLWRLGDRYHLMKFMLSTSVLTTLKLCIRERSLLQSLILTLSTIDDSQSEHTSQYEVLMTASALFNGNFGLKSSDIIVAALNEIKSAENASSCEDNLALLSVVSDFVHDMDRGEPDMAELLDFPFDRFPSDDCSQLAVHAIAERLRCKPRIQPFIEIKSDGKKVYVV